MWRLRGESIINEKGKALDVAGGIDREGQNIIVFNANGKIHQKWGIRYVDEDKEEPGKGDLNEEWGFYVERPFYVESHYGKKRWLDIHGSNLVVNTPKWGYETQQFYFD
jgi:hypothetical protein